MNLHPCRSISIFCYKECLLTPFAYQDETVVKSHHNLYEVKSMNEEDGLIIIQIEEFKDE